MNTENYRLAQKSSSFTGHCETRLVSRTKFLRDLRTNLEHIFAVSRVSRIKKQFHYFLTHIFMNSRETKTVFVLILAIYRA